MPKLTFSEKHLLRIARATLRYPDPIARIMGGPSIEEESRHIVARLEAKEKGLTSALWLVAGFIPQEEGA